MPIFSLIALVLHSGLLCNGQGYYERNPLPVETLSSLNYEEDYTEGNYDFQDQVYRWNVAEYPHPQRHFKFCGRMSESFVCDPDSVLEKEQADKLDASIRQLYQGTPCICGQANCKEGDGGIVVGIALLKTLYQPYNQHPSKTIRSFSEFLRNTWKLGKCDNDILIVVATTDRLSFTDVGKATSSYVSLDEAHRIFLEHKAHFTGGRFYEGLQAMLGDYEARTRTMRAPTEPSDDTDMGVVAGGIVGAVAILGIVLFIVVVVYRRCKNKRKDVETADHQMDGKSEGVSSPSWRKKDIKVLFNSLKSTDKRSQSSAKYQPCETNETQPTKKNSFVIGDEIIDTTLATPVDNHDDTQITTVTDGDSATTAMLDRELTEAVEDIAQTFKPKRDIRARHETDL
ncbi:hypothetical protein JTE90_008593 [Oedothorax gibbosus]|uniref:Uncharacterized protein n=1 Tax=Oedothorax gibbosus TaxID=931172 RepID=A0AAV6UAU7_9ARAC|nr:hypothetical protein JTE90_008593 [Oedothorax gibbosus]